MGDALWIALWRVIEAAAVVWLREGGLGSWRGMARPSGCSIASVVVQRRGYRHDELCFNCVTWWEY